MKCFECWNSLYFKWVTEILPIRTRDTLCLVGKLVPKSLNLLFVSVQRWFQKFSNSTCYLLKQTLSMASFRLCLVTFNGSTQYVITLSEPKPVFYGKDEFKSTNVSQNERITPISLNSRVTMFPPLTGSGVDLSPWIKRVHWSLCEENNPILVKTLYLIFFFGISLSHLTLKT